MRRFLVSVMAIAVLSAPALADMRFQRLDEDDFVIHHRKKTRFGGEGKAMETLYTEVASVCVAAGFQYFEVKREFSEGRQIGRGASAMMEVRFSHDETNDDAIRCLPLSDKGKVKKARQKLGQ